MKIHDEWNYLSYELNGVRVPATEIEKVKINDKWVNVSAQRKSGTYNDMGHVYDYTTHVLVYEVDDPVSEEKVTVKFTKNIAAKVTDWKLVENPKTIIY